MYILIGIRGEDGLKPKAIRVRWAHGALELISKAVL